MIKCTTALRLGTAETEAILRRFTRSNVQHPTYKALAELGKAIKTIFLCTDLWMTTSLTATAGSVPNSNSSSGPG
jgi:TnpA family transposase